MKKLFLACFVFIGLNASSQSASVWKASIHRPDGNNIVFNFMFFPLQQTASRSKEKPSLYIMNAGERIRVDSVTYRNDSVFIKMPVFESAFKAKIENGKWDGVWIKGTAGSDLVLPFTAERGKERFDTDEGNAKQNITGRWAVTFASDKSKAEASIAEFSQKGNKISGTFLTPTGDYRFQEGVVTGNHLKLSGFDGGHAYLFTADIINSKTIANGVFFSGAKYKEGWTAVKDAKAKVNTDVAAMFLKPGEDKLNFHFPDLTGKEVSIEDDRFKNKVVIVQILGSWCPNCMDETEFLSDYYNSNKQRGIEAVALAYEYSTDFQRSVKSLTKFQQRFNVQYPVLITGVTVSDTLRTEKTLPQVTPIKVFPTTIIIDKKGKVRKFETGFFGPGTGSHFTDFKKEFYATMDRLLKE